MSLRWWVYAVTWHMFGIWIGKCMLIKLGFGKEEYGFKKNVMRMSLIIRQQKTLEATI